MFKTRFTDIVDDFFDIGGNHDVAKDKEFRSKILDFLKEEDNILLAPWDDANIMLAKDMVHFIDADRIYARTTNSKEAYPHVKPFFERLIESDHNNWHYYDLKLLISSVNFTENIEQAVELAEKAEERIIQFKRVRATEVLQGYLALNMCARLLNAKYFDKDVKFDLAYNFESWLEKLDSLADDTKELELALLITKIRWDIFNRDKSQLLILCDNLVSRFGGAIGKMIRNEVDLYFGSYVFESEEIRKEYGEGLGGEL